MLALTRLIAISLLAAAEVLASEPRLAIEADVATIRTMSVVSDGYDGEAGVTPESVYAFRRLVGAPRAKDLFAALLLEATPSGQLYALCGLFFTDAEAFRSALPAFENSDNEVPHQQGCTLSADTVGDMLYSPYRPVIHLEPGESPDVWFARHPLKRKGGFHVDIAGGGFCHLINGTLWPDEAVPSN